MISDTLFDALSGNWTFSDRLDLCPLLWGHGRLDRWSQGHEAAAPAVPRRPGPQGRSGK